MRNVGSRIGILVMVALGATGCVSSRTWSAIRSVEVELDARERAAPMRGETDTPLDASVPTDCGSIARTVVATYPGLASFRDRARAALAEARAAGAPPPPQLMLQVWGFPIGDPSTADRAGMYMVGVGQELPPAGMLDGRARAAAEEARVALAELDERARSLHREAAMACAERAQAVQMRAAIDAQLLVTERMRDVVASRFPAGHDVLAALSRIELERARATRRRAELDARIARSDTVLDALLGQPDGSPLPPTSQARRETLPSLEALLAVALEHRGTLAASRARERSAEARAEAASAAADVPTFGVAASYMQAPQAPAALSVTFTMSLPWLWSGEAAARDGARLESAAAADATRGMERDLAVEIARILGEVRAQRATLAALRDEEEPAATRALEAVAAAYLGGGSDLTSWLEAARMLEEIALERATLEGDEARAWVELEALVGAPVAPGTTGGAR